MNSIKNFVVLGLIIGFFILGSTALYVFTQNKNSGKKNVAEQPTEEVKTEDVKIPKAKEESVIPQNFDFNVSAEKEVEFTKQIAVLYPSQTKQKEIADFMATLKKVYPEGYYVVTIFTIKEPKSFKDFYQKPDADSANLLVHELTHGGGSTCHLRHGAKCASEAPELPMDEWNFEGFWTENTGVSIKRIDDIFPNTKVLEWLKKRKDLQLDEFFNTYLDSNTSALFGPIDELNAYTKSVRTLIAYKNAGLIGQESAVSDPGSLGRIIFILEMYLKYANEFEKKVWEEIVDSKAIAISIKNLLGKAEFELARAEKEGLKDSYAAESWELYRKAENYGIFEKLFTEAGVNNVNAPFSKENAVKYGYELEVIN